MNIERITIRSGRTFNHPTERFANFSFSLELQAALVPGEDPAQCIEQLRTQAEGLAEQHKRDILDDITRAEQRKSIASTIRALRQKPEHISKMEALIRKINTETRAKIESGDRDTVMQWRRCIPGDKEEETQSALQQIEIRLQELVEEINEAEKEHATLPAVLASYASLPEPRLLGLPEKQIHPGHPHHPDTDGWDEDD